MTEAEKTHSYKTETALTKPRVVIIGGGFGGLCAARGLVGAPVSVTLIDKRNYHLFVRQRTHRNGDRGKLSPDLLQCPARRRSQSLFVDIWYHVLFPFCGFKGSGPTKKSQRTE